MVGLASFIPFDDLAWYWNVKFHVRSIYICLFREHPHDHQLGALANEILGTEIVYGITTHLASVLELS